MTNPLHTATLRAATVAALLVTVAACGTAPGDLRDQVAAAPPAQTFSFTGATQTVTVPAGVTAVTIAAIGGPGAPGTSDRDCATPLSGAGDPASVTGTIPVTPGQTMTVSVGGRAATAGCNGATTSAGGWGAAASGGDGYTNLSDGSSGGGGGATTVTLDGQPLVIAAGGGGGGEDGAWMNVDGKNNGGHGGAAGLSYLVQGMDVPAVRNGGDGGDGSYAGHGGGGDVGAQASSGMGSPGAAGENGSDTGGPSGGGGGGWGGGSAGGGGGFGGGGGGGGGAGFTFVNGAYGLTNYAVAPVSADASVTLTWVA
jgi:hypothetical protein